jgi:UDP-N-acetylmuramate dehydrogenase
VSWYAGLEHIVRQEEPLAPLNWFRLGGPAEYFAEPTSVDELAELLRRCSRHRIPIRLLGAGANLLVSDAGVDGVVVHLSAPAFCHITVAQNTVQAGGGAKLGHVVATAAREGLAGLQALVGIPGSVGGALRGNAMGHGAAIGQWTDRVTVMSHDGQIHQHSREQLDFGYHQSNLDEVIILEAVFELEPQDTVELTRQMQRLWIAKRASEPTGEHGGGRIFADPRGISAAELIEQAGLKGARVGGAEVSDRNPNFIVAHPGATSADVTELIVRIRNHVSEQLGVTLDCQIHLWSRSDQS